MRGHQRFATLVGKNSLLREGAARLLLSANFRVLAAVSCVHKLAASKAEPGQRLFLIIHAGDQFDTTLSQIQVLRNRHPHERIAVVADCYRPAELLSAFRAGANGYFTGTMNSDVFIKSIELVMMGETVFPPDFRSLLFASDPGHRDSPPRSEDQNQTRGPRDERPALLSPRESSILGCLIAGDSNKCIARKIDIAEATVKVHIKAILRKIRVQNRTQAAIWAVNEGWHETPKIMSPHLSPVAPEAHIAASDQFATLADIETIAPVNVPEPGAKQPEDRNLPPRKTNANGARSRELRR
jgi:DNA-binding NarL/FixJ family response regulator